MNLIAICASYGAAGSAVGRAIAERLDVPFLDRAIPMAVAEHLRVPINEVLDHDEAGGTRLEQGLRGFLGLDGCIAAAPVEPVTSDDFRAAVERVVLSQVATGAGVILGRGAVALLRDDPRVLRIRLGGPADRRAAQVTQRGGVAPEVSRRSVARSDRGHAAYVARHYGVDVNDRSLYHLMIDSTALTVEGCAAMVSAAARALRSDAARPAPARGRITPILAALRAPVGASAVRSPMLPGMA